MEYFFTADLHLGHKRILYYCNRPFKSIGEHDWRLINLWNERVKPEDVVFYLGDFCYKSAGGIKAQEYRQRLNGNIIFIAGNHDRTNSLKTCIQDIRIYLGGKNLLLIHNPNESSYGFDLVLSGHIHQHWKFKTMTYEKYKWDVVNVGVDCWRGRPINIQDILEAYGKWKRDGLQEISNFW